MKFAQQMRLVWIDAKLSTGEMLRRADLSEAFEISTQQAAKDITAYAGRHPDLIRYDVRERGYFREGDVSAYPTETRDAVRAAQGAVRSVSS